VETELEELKRTFPNYDTTTLKARTNSKGEIIKLETNDTALQARMRDMGFTES